MDIMKQFNVLMAMNADYLPNEYDGDIYHYTSPSGFQSILFGNRSDVVLWASRFDCLNDVSEGTVAEEILKEVAYDLLLQKEITAEMYRQLSCIKTAHTIPLHREVEGELKFTRPECDRYVCSFSKNEDSLAMWNYYSKGSRYEGYNIGFYSKAMKMTLERSLIGIEAVSHIYPVIYDKGEQKEYITKTLKRVIPLYSDENLPRIRAIISTRLLDWGLIFKKSCFKHEEEVRIIIDLAKKERLIPVNYRINAGYVIPYIELKFEQEDVTGVTLGPLLGGESHSSKQQQIMLEMLKKNGYPIAKVGCSSIPVRF